MRLIIDDMPVFLDGPERISTEIAVDFEQLQAQTQHDVSSGTPERKLMAAVLDRAVRDAIADPAPLLLKRVGKESKRKSGSTVPMQCDKEEALRWIYTDGYSPLREDCRDGWTITEICEELGVSIDRIRALVANPSTPSALSSAASL